MPTKHTPGPWKRCHRGDYSDFEGNSVVVVGRNDCCRVAVVHHAGHEEDEANANLIAAAPKLLETLKAALEESGCDGELCCRPWHESAREIIAKAEGRDD